METISIVRSAKLQPVEDIKNRVKTFEDACDVLGLSGVIANISTHELLAPSLKSIIAGIKLEVIIKALNQGWTPNWNDSSEYKYYPWWNMKGTFSLYGVDCYSTESVVGSRLCYKSREIAEYAGTQFLDLYKQFMVIE